MKLTSETAYLDLLEQISGTYSQGQILAVQAAMPTLHKLLTGEIRLL